MKNWLKDFHVLMYDDIIKRKKEYPAIIFIFFTFSFIIARLTSYQILPYFPLYVRDYHIHHFFYGVLLICISNWISLISDTKRLKNIAAAIFGIGLGFWIDEIGLQLTCTSDYLNCDYGARITYDVFTIMVVLFLLILFFDPLYARTKRLFIRFFKKV